MWFVGLVLLGWCSMNFRSLVMGGWFGFVDFGFVEFGFAGGFDL